LDFLIIFLGHFCPFDIKVLSELLDGGASELMNSFATSRHGTRLTSSRGGMEEWEGGYNLEKVDGDGRNYVSRLDRKGTE